MPRRYHTVPFAYVDWISREGASCDAAPPLTRCGARTLLSVVSRRTEAGIAHHLNEVEDSLRCILYGFFGVCVVPVNEANMRVGRLFEGEVHVEMN